MKKIKFLLILMLVSFVLAGCDFSVFENDELKKCLDNSKPLTAETIDEMFEESEVPEDLFTNFELGNTKVTLDFDGEQNDIYLWQEDYNIYLGYEEYESSQVVYLNLENLETLYDESISETKENKVKPSEILESLLEQYRSEMNLSDAVTLDNILELFNYEYDDFEEVEQGKYKVKKEVLYSKILKLAIEKITLEEFIEMLSENKADISLFVYCDGEHITDYEVVVKDDEEEAKVKLSFLYNEDLFVGIGVNLNFSGYLINLTIKFENEALAINFDLDTESQDVMFEFIASNKELKSQLIYADEQLFKAELKYDFSYDDNQCEFTLSSAEITIREYGKISVIGGSNVVIPSILKSNQANAVDIFDML